jgi:hypothetical protein
MGSFTTGASKTRSVNNAIGYGNAKVGQALQPQQYGSEFGYTNGQGNYHGSNSALVNDTISGQQQQIQKLSQGLPQSFSVNQMYNNPYYQTTRDMYAQPVLRQYGQDLNGLNSDLSASGQMGGAYDALRHSQLQQNRDYNLNLAENQGRLASSQAYNQNLQNQLGTISGLRSDIGSALQQYYLPQQIANQTQSAVTPLQTAAAQQYGSAAQTVAGNYASQPTWFDNYLNFINAGANGFKAVASAGAKGGG